MLGIFHSSYSVNFQKFPTMSIRLLLFLKMWFCLTLLKLMFLLYRNQSLDWHCESKLTLHKKMKFSIKEKQVFCGLVTFTEKILHGNLQFLCSIISLSGNSCWTFCLFLYSRMYLFYLLFYLFLYSIITFLVSITVLSIIIISLSYCTIWKVFLEGHSFLKNWFCLIDHFI